VGRHLGVLRDGPDGEKGLLAGGSILLVGELLREAVDGSGKSHVSVPANEAAGGGNARGRPPIPESLQKFFLCAENQAAMRPGG